MEAENSGLATIDKIVNKINSVKKSLKIQEDKVKDARKLLYPEEEILGELEKENEERIT